MLNNKIDVFKLIENFINKSNGQTNNNKNEELKLLTPPESPLNKEEEEEEGEEIVNVKPNRPYSYYVATNFHPVDQIATPEAVKTNNDDESSIKKKSSKKKNRLSVSMTDIKKPINNKLNTINSVTDDAPKDRLYKHFSSSQNFTLNQNSKLKTFELNHNKAKTTNRLNRLFRRLFTFNRKIKSSSPLSSSTNTPMTMIDQQDHINSYNDEDEEDTSRFVRFFSSFRSSSLRKNKNEKPTLKITSPAAIVASTTEIDSSQNLPHISLNKINSSYESTKTLINETFYLQVVEKLKNIADDCLSSSNESSSSSACIENIPFIDDEDDQNEDETTIMSVSFDSSNTFNELNSCLNGNRFLSSTKNTNIRYTKYDLSEESIKKLVGNICYETFDNIVANITSIQNSIDWSQIAVVFELISRTIKYLGSVQDDDDLSLKLKAIAVDYINNKYNSWIQKNGGWLSVAESKTISCKSVVELNAINF